MTTFEFKTDNYGWAALASAGAGLVAILALRFFTGRLDLTSGWAWLWFLIFPAVASIIVHLVHEFEGDKTSYWAFNIAVPAGLILIFALVALFSNAFKVKATGNNRPSDRPMTKTELHQFEQGIKHFRDPKKYDNFTHGSN